ncbi:MAG: HAMP domain-containing sensor histidine kinase [Raoultibacter sp.]
MTVLVAIGVLSFVWEQHFQSYTRTNLENTAMGIATQIAERYSEQGDFSDVVIQPAKTTYNESSGIGIIVTKKDGTVIWDSTLSENGTEQGTGTSTVDDTPQAQTEAGDSGQDQDQAKSQNTEQNQTEANTQSGTDLKKSSLAPSPPNRVPASIKVDGETVGYVSVWVYGSNTLLRTQDVEFRERSYQAMIFAAAIAIVLALCIGFLFARTLVRPINRMTSTAKAMKEGDMSARTNMRGDDEISRLGETFDAMAESVEKDRELERRLTTDVAHELRTPLMAIQSTVEAMVDGVFKPDTERLETVNSEVQRLSRLVDALLKLSRLENRSTPMKEEIVDVGSLISGIISTHDAFVIDSGLTMEFNSERNVFVYGDADMIRQATANLISNAVRYTPEGGHITVSVKKGDIMASISVQDTGIGLTPEEAKMVFSRFWRADAGRNRESGGLGVGLAVVKEIVDRHGGWVHVEGKPNKGATFTIYIPLYDENRVKNKAKNKEKTKSRPKK